MKIPRQIPPMQRSTSTELRAGVDPSSYRAWTDDRCGISQHAMMRNFDEAPRRFRTHHPNFRSYVELDSRGRAGPCRQF